jgi:phosphoglycolate phosphatase
MPTAIIFDLDGTLVDAFQDIANAINGPLGRRGYPQHSVSRIMELVGEGAGKLIERALPPDVDASVVADVKAEMMRYYREHPADFATVYEGIHEVLQAARRQGCKLGVLSNKPHPMTIATCEKVGLAEYFDDMVGEQGGEIPRKPDPTGLRLQLERLGATEAIMVGDGIPDGQVALAAGIPFVGVLWGTRSAEQLAPYNPVALASSPAELMEALMQLVQNEALPSRDS